VKQIMTAASALRLFISLFWLFALLKFVPPSASSDWPPPSLQAWTTEREAKTIPPSLGVALATLAGASIISSVGLLCLRRWAAPMFLASTLLSYVAVALLGPSVSHGASYACEGIAAVCAGIVISLSYGSDALRAKGT